MFPQKQPQPFSCLLYTVKPTPTKKSYPIYVKNSNFVSFWSQGFKTVRIFSIAFFITEIRHFQILLKLYSFVTNNFCHFYSAYRRSPANHKLMTCTIAKVFKQPEPNSAPKLPYREIVKSGQKDSLQPSAVLWSRPEPDFLAGAGTGAGEKAPAPGCCWLAQGTVVL